jgi:site-specific DNA recombinase
MTSGGQRRARRPATKPPAAGKPHNEAEDTTRLRVAIYVRVSSEEQVKNTSLGDQLDRCRTEATRRGWRIVGEFVEEGVSGTLLNRPALDRLLVQCRDGRFDVVMVAKLDRFSRDELTRLMIERELRECGVRRVALDLPFEASDTPESEMFSGLLGNFAQYERKRIIERMARGAHRSAAERGGWPTSRTPFGYRHVHPGQDSRLVIDEGEAETARLAVELLLDRGMSTGEICRHLNGLGHRTPYGRQWMHQNLVRKLTSRGLRGEFAWGKVERGVATGKYGEAKQVRAEPILSEEQWQAVQQALARTAYGTKRPDHIYPLSGRLMCDCGEPFGGVWRHDRDLRQYRCRAAKWTSTSAPRCRAHRIEAEWVEQQVWFQVVDLLSKPQALLSCVSDYLGVREGQQRIERTELAAVEARISRLERALTRATKESLMADDSGPLQLAIAEITQELAEARKLKADQESWQSEAVTESRRMRDLSALAEIAAQTLPDANLEEMMGILTLLDIRVAVLDDPPDRPPRGGSHGDRRPWRPQLHIQGCLPHTQLLNRLLAGNPDAYDAPPVAPRRRRSGWAASARPL